MLLVKWFIVIAFIAISALLYMKYLARMNRTITHELFFTHLPTSFDGLRLFFISDIHFRIVSDEVLEKIKGNVDLIIIGGDLMEAGVPFENVENNIRKLRALAPVYFVWGNNDYEGDFRRLDKFLRESEVSILANCSVRLVKDGASISLVGVEDVGYRRDRLDEAMLESEGFRILVSHNPDIIKKITPEHRISLVLSGHTHGGQIRLFGWGLREKGQLKQADNTLLLISNGYGTTRIHLRFGALPETHIITLRAVK